MLDEKRQAAKAKRRKLAAEIGMHQTIRLLEQEGLLFHDDKEGEINLDLIEAQLSELIKQLWYSDENGNAALRRHLFPTPPSKNTVVTDPLKPSETNRRRLNTD